MNESEVDLFCMFSLCLRTEIVLDEKTKWFSCNLVGFLNGFEMVDISQIVYHTQKYEHFRYG